MARLIAWIHLVISRYSATGIGISIILVQSRDAQRSDSRDFTLFQEV